MIDVDEIREVTADRAVQPHVVAQTLEERARLWVDLSDHGVEVVDSGLNVDGKPNATVEVDVDFFGEDAVDTAPIGGDPDDVYLGTINEGRCSSLGRCLLCLLAVFVRAVFVSGCASADG